MDLTLPPLASENQGVMRPMASNGWANFTAYGPAAARAATAFANMQSYDSVRALSLLASDPTHQPAELTRIADEWLPHDADVVLGAGTLGVDQPFSSFSTVNPAIANPPASQAWETVRNFGLDNTIDAGPKSILPLLNQNYAWGAAPLTTSLFEGGGQTATLAMQAASPAPSAKIGSQWGKNDFRAAGAFFASGGLGALAGTVANALGAGGLLSVGIGAATGGLALWQLTDKLVDGSYSNAWKTLASIPGKAVDTVLDWLAPGSNVAAQQNQPTAPSAAMLPLAMTAPQPSALDIVHDVWHDIFG